MRSAWLAVFLATAGCVADDVVQPLTVYVENSSRSAARFELRVDQDGPIEIARPAPTSQPDVVIAHRGHVDGRAFKVEAKELNFDLSVVRTFDVASENFVLVEVFENRTLELYFFDREPVFD